MIKAEITNKELLSHLDKLQKDEMHVFIAQDGLFRGALFHGTRFINQMRSQHNLGILETVVLGQAALCAALMIQTLKGKSHVMIKYETDGAAKGFSVEVDSTGYVRGYLLQDNIPIDTPLESWDLEPFFGNGTLTVTRYGEIRQGQIATPQVGVVEIKHKNIAQDLAYYFSQSEQINTAFHTSIQFDTEGNVIGAGGLFVQQMPDIGGKICKAANLTEDDFSQKMENALLACPSLGQWFSENQDPEDIIYGLFREFRPSVAFKRDIIFDCPCSKEGYTQSIKNLGKAEIDDIKAHDADPLEILCHNCGSVYKIAHSEL